LSNMKSTLCCECGVVKMKKIELRDIDGYGMRKTEDMLATEDTTQYHTIIEVWCPNCGIMFKPGV